MRLRLSGGRFRGRNLSVAEADGLRPTTDKTRQALFNILGTCVEGASVLDVYAGTGALGFEALSRGASEVVFVEKNRELCDCLSANAATLGVVSQVTVLNGDASACLDGKLPQRGWSLLFLDPPYDIFPSPNLTSLSNYLEPDGVLVYEYSGRMTLPDDLLPSCERVLDKRYGDAALAFFRKRKD